jgi:hypothetical protein
MGKSFLRLTTAQGRHILVAFPSIDSIEELESGCLLTVKGREIVVMEDYTRLYEILRPRTAFLRENQRAEEA